MSTHSTIKAPHQESTPLVDPRIAPDAGGRAVSAPRLLARRELTARQRSLRAGTQFAVFLGSLLVVRGLASGAHWVFAPQDPYQVGAFAPLSPPASLAALLAGPALCIVAAILADKNRAGAR